MYYVVARLMHVIWQYVSLSKRLVPEVINYLVGVLFLAAYKVKGKGEYFVCFLLKYYLLII